MRTNSFYQNFVYNCICVILWNVAENFISVQISVIIFYSMCYYFRNQHIILRKRCPSLRGGRIEKSYSNPTQGDHSLIVEETVEWVRFLWFRWFSNMLQSLTFWITFYLHITVNLLLFLKYSQKSIDATTVSSACNCASTTFVLVASSSSRSTMIRSKPNT